MAAGSTGTRPRTLRQGVLLALCWGVIALGACDRPPPALEVGPIGFTEDDLGVLGPAQQRTLIDLAAFGLAVAEGRVETLVRPHVERDLRSLIIQRLAMELAADRAGLGEPELRLAYDANPQHELVVRHLVVMSERWRPAEHRDSARALAAEARERARAGEPFEQLAGEYSDEPGAAERGGLLQPGREGSWVPEFWEAASALAVGEVSPVVATEFGFHVIKLEERRRVPFEEVRDEVVRDVMDLPLALGRADEWARRRMATARIDSAAVRAALFGCAADSVEHAPLVQWPDSLDIPPLRADDLADYRAALPADDPASSASPDEDEDMSRAIEMLRTASQSHMMVHHAEELGIRPSEPQAAAIERRWRDRASRWATAFGFEEGQSRERVKEQALIALGSPAQNAAIARSELEDLSVRLRQLYPVRRPAQSVSSAEAGNSATSG